MYIYTPLYTVYYSWKIKTWNFDPNGVHLDT